MIIIVCLFVFKLALVASLILRANGQQSSPNILSAGHHSSTSGRRAGHPGDVHTNAQYCRHLLVANSKH